MKTTIGDILDSTFSGEWGNEERNGGTQVLRTTNFNDDGSLDYANPAFRAVPEKVVKKKQLQRGDILLEKSGGTPKKPVGKLAFFDYEGTFLCSNFNQVMRPNRSVAVPKYLYYLLLNLYQNGVFYRYTRKTTGLQNIQIKALLKHFIDLPSTAVQRERASILGTIDDLSRSLAQMTTLCEQLVKSRFIEMFGDYNLAPQKREWASISSVGIVVGGATPKTKVDAYWGGNAVWITPAELKDGNVFVDDSARKLTPEGIKSASLTLMPRNTVILSSRAPIGKVAIANCDLYCNQGFKNIICGDTLAPRYLYELLRFNSDFLNSLGKGATFKEISKKTVEEVRIPIPPISSQQEYESFVSQVDKLRFDVQQQIEKLQTLKKSLMQEYFG